MTTNTGSVWDRGPGDEENPLDSSPTAAVADPSDDRSGDPSDAVPTTVEPTVPVVDAPARPVDTVWSRGPSTVDAPLEPVVTKPVVDRPVVAENPLPILPPARPPVPRPRTMPAVRRPAKVLAGALVIVLLGALAWSLGVVGGDEVDPALAVGTTQPLMPSVSLPTSAAPTSAAPATTAPVAEPVTVPSTSSSTVAPETTSTTTTTSSTSTTTSSTTTSSTSTVPPTSAAPVAAAGPRVLIVGRIGPCTFGPDCLVADFTIADFPAPQAEFVCEFENGSRYTFRFGGAGAERACSTTAAAGSITIEVGGVRSETITR